MADEVTFRISESLHRRLKAKAIANEVSREAILQYLVEARYMDNQPSTEESRILHRLEQEQADKEIKAYRSDN